MNLVGSKALALRRLGGPNVHLCPQEVLPEISCKEGLGKAVVYVSPIDLHWHKLLAEETNRKE